MSSIKKVLCVKATNNHDRNFITNKIYDVEIDGSLGFVNDEKGYSTCLILNSPCIYGEWQPLEEYVCMTNFYQGLKIGDTIFCYHCGGMILSPQGDGTNRIFAITENFKKFSEIPCKAKSFPRFEVRHVIYDAKDDKVANDAMGECYITLAEAQELCDEMNAPKVMKTVFTKEVKYFGVKIMVPENTKYLATSMAGTVLASEVAMETGVCTWGNDSAIYTVCIVDLNGIDWEETLVEIK